MHLFGLNWQLQELDNQPAFENGGVGKTGPTQSSIVTALAADGEEIKALYLNKSLTNFEYCLLFCWRHVAIAIRVVFNLFIIKIIN